MKNVLRILCQGGHSLITEIYESCSIISQRWYRSHR